MSDNTMLFREFFNTEEKDAIWKEASAMKEDLVFLAILLERTKKSSQFSYEIYPKVNRCCFRLLKKLWEEKYQYFRDEIQEMLFEWYTVKKFVLSLNEEGPRMPYEKEIALLQYFKDVYNLDVCDYVGDFIGCSHSCTSVLRILGPMYKDNGITF